MTTARNILIDATIALYYHLVSRCVRGAFLCGKDPFTGEDCSHRKQWLVQRMLHLAKYFAVEVNAFAVLSNHFHIVLYFDPTASALWSDEEVAERWVQAFPPKHQGKPCKERMSLYKKMLLENKALLEKRRKQLGSLSSYMQHLKQPIAYRANQEEGCKGHFFEQRFYSGALLSDKALKACMAYVDLNPIQAKIAKSLKQCANTSISMRLQAIENSLERLKEVLKPVVSGLGQVAHRVSFTLEEYIAYLKARVEFETQSHQSNVKHKQRSWFDQVAAFRKKQKAYGSLEAITLWSKARDLKRVGSPLPE